MAKQVTILGRDDVAKLLESGAEISAYVTITGSIDVELALDSDDLRKLLAADDYDDALDEMATTELQDLPIGEYASLDYGEMIVNGDEADLELRDDDELATEEEAELGDRLLQYHRVLHKAADFDDLDAGGYMIVHGTSVELGEDFSASLDDVGQHTARLVVKYGAWAEGPYPTI